MFPEYPDVYLSEIIKRGYYEDCSKDSYETTVLILTYNPDFRKLLCTINSVLVQKEIRPQIVISDDGSVNFDFTRIIEYFEKRNFHDYILCALEKNGGTVRNFNNGLKYCKGKYVKPISPGDNLYSENILRQWTDFINQNDGDVSFGNVISYHFEDNNMVPDKTLAYPQIIDKYYNNMWSYNYIIFDDIVVGAATLVRTDVMREYEGYLMDKVIYADDNAYRLMAYRKKKMCYFNADTVLYEYGTGMSTSGQKIWSERLNKDWDNANDIIMTWISNGEINELTESFKRVVRLRKNGSRFKRILSSFQINGKLKYRLERKLKARYTNCEIDEKYVNLISQY